MNQVTAIGFDSEQTYEQAQRLAQQYNLIIDNNILPRLSMTEDKLVLLFSNFLPLYADFTSQTWQKRHAAGKKQGLVSACKPTQGMRIVDATAGWGRDAAILASFGAEVLMLERSPLIAALLADALVRAGESASRLSLLTMDAKQYLRDLALPEHPDVIYIDPMHPLRQKSALVKKDMQALQQLIGADEDVEELIKIAMKKATQRVVVKWPQKLAPLVQPTRSIEGKTVRFDIY